MNRIDCSRCGTAIGDSAPRMEIAVVLVNERREGSEVLGELHLCERCRDVAEDALSLETTIVAPQRSPEG